jgi:flagellar basal body P-ring formation protein FlgA
VRIGYTRWIAIVFAVLALHGYAGQIPQADKHVQIELQMNAIVTGRTYVVSDIAIVRASDVALKTAVENVKIGNAPRVGYMDQVTRAELAQIVGMRLFGIGEHIELLGAKAVKVRSAGQIVDMQWVADEAKFFLTRKLATKFDNVQISLVSALAEVDVPVGKIGLKPRPIDVNRFTRRWPIWMDILVDGAVYRSVVVPFNVQVTASVYTARRNLPEGTVVTAGDFVSRQEDVSELVEKLLTADSMQGAMRIKKPLTAGQIVLREHVSPEGVILRGDHVTLRIAVGDVSIETSAVAQQDGGIGKIIKVKPEKSSEAISGRVVAPGVVQADGR